MNMFLSAKQAAARLGIAPATLYAYVSRGLLAAEPGPDGRTSRYAAEQVDALAASRRRGRRPREVARATLDFGLPVLESALTAVQDGRFYYRGRDAVALAAHATLEEVAALLWDMALPKPAASVARGPARHPVPEAPSLLAAFAATGPDAVETEAWIADPARRARGCLGLLRGLCGLMTGVAPGEVALHAHCATVWGVDAHGAALIRAALVLCADHELNASSFTVRCVAGTGASLHAALLAGLAALSGPRHGGITARVAALWTGLDPANPEAGLRARLARGEDMPGFGHPLYPAGDPRAAALLAALPEGAALAATITALTGQRPSLDFALVALARHLDLPAGAAFGIFALGRAVGWIAHALEQRAAARLIRPRAVYVGPRPET
ncbi:MAG: citrate synthase family protein [Rhodospirillales bacterium]|nr:citrate synthase family protein [Rhodospirillales bacterium]